MISDMKKSILFFSLILTYFSKPTYAQISLASFSTGYFYPVDIKNCGDDRLFIVQQNGLIRISDTAGIKNTQPFLDITGRVKFVGSNDERGLLGLAFAPDYLTSGYFYVNYVALSDGHTHISRFHVNPATPDSADPSSEEILLSISQPYTNHKGGHLGFGPDGYLYIGMGDGGSGGDPENRAQNPDSLLGKILRIAVDPLNPTYSIPPTNPFANGVQGRPEVWALGIRNPWRWSFDRLTGDLWIGDVGQNAIEEIDFQPAGSPGGLNYGWRCFEANTAYNSTGGCQPYSSYVPNVFQYNHSPYCSVTGGYIYRGSRFQELYGKYFFTDYCKADIRYLEANPGGGFSQTNLGLLGAASISGFGEDKNGEIYCAGLSSGTIYHIISANCAPVSTINAGKDTLDDCSSGNVQLLVPSGNGNTYQWLFNGNIVGTDSSISATQQGTYFVTVNNQTCTSTDSIYVKFTSGINLTVANLDTLYCVYNPTVNLLPSYLGGSFSGPGTNGLIATFNPALAGIGLHTITYSYTTTTGCPFSFSKNVRIDACLNVSENKWTNTISIFPNPSEGDFYLKVFASKEKKFSMEVQDISGRIVYAETYVIDAGENQIPVQASLSKGIYSIKFTDAASSSSRKFIVR